MYVLLQIFSKNQNLLSRFLLFLSKINLFKKVVKNSVKTKKKKFLTVLKSPHVNKSAQEQFEYRLYKKSFFIWSPQLKILLLFLKKSLSNFPGIQIRVFFFSNNHEITKNFVQKSLKPDNFKLNFFSLNCSKFKFNKKLDKYLNCSDCHGEIVRS